WPGNLSGGRDDSGKLFVGQHAVPSHFLCGQGHAFCWGSIDDCSTHAPAQESLERLQRLVRRNRSPSLFNSCDEFNYVSFDDLMNAPAGPDLTDFAAKESGNLVRGAGL